MNEALDKAVRYYGQLLVDNGIDMLTEVEVSVEYPVGFSLYVKGYDKNESTEKES